MSPVTVIRSLPAVPEVRQVHARMGFKPQRADIPLSMRALVEEAFYAGKDLARPAACYALRAVLSWTPDRVEAEGGFTVASRKAAARLEGCAGIYLAAVTLGPDLDRRVAELSAAGDVTRAFLLNAWGAEAAEALMEALNRELARLEAAQRRSLTPRYSPGYGDWGLAAQRDLLGALETHRIGITLTASCLMIPEKSVSAVMGVKARGPVIDSTK